MEAFSVLQTDMSYAKFIVESDSELRFAINVRKNHFYSYLTFEVGVVKHANFYIFKFLSSASSLSKKSLVPHCRPFNLLQGRPKNKTFHWGAILEKFVF
jgi:hypothetical protein